jgi:hypothetical protein
MFHCQHEELHQSLLSLYAIAPKSYIWIQFDGKKHHVCAGMLSHSFMGPGIGTGLDWTAVSLGGTTGRGSTRIMHNHSLSRIILQVIAEKLSEDLIHLMMNPAHAFLAFTRGSKPEKLVNFV